MTSIPSGALKKIFEKMPSIPSTNGIDTKTKPIVDAMKKILETGMGLHGPESAWLNTESLTGPSSILMDILSNSGKIVPNVSVDFSTPPRPERLEIVGTFNNIYLSWNKAGYRNHSFTEIFRSATDDLGTATSIGKQFTGTVYVDAVDDGVTYFYWIRFISFANVAGSYNSASGTEGYTVADPARILASLTDNITESHLVEALANDIDLLRNEKIMKVDAYGRVAGIGASVVEGESGEVEGIVIVYADKFAIVIPDDQGGSVPSVPFVVGRVNGRTVVGINGQLVVDGSIHGRSIVAESIAADKLTVSELSAIVATMGTVVGGTFKTNESPEARVEMTSIGDFFLWAGEGAKSPENASFYIDKNGNAVFAGELRAVNGTFTGTLDAADGVFRGTIYAENIVGDVLERLSVSVANTAIPYTYNYVPAYGSPGVTEPYLGELAGPIVHSNPINVGWLRLERYRIESAPFDRRFSVSRAGFVVPYKGSRVPQLGGFSYQLRVLANGSQIWLSPITTKTFDIVEYRDSDYSGFSQYSFTGDRHISDEVDENASFVVEKNKAYTYEIQARIFTPIDITPQHSRVSIAYFNSEIWGIYKKYSSRKAELTKQTNGISYL